MVERADYRQADDGWKNKWASVCRWWAGGGDCVGGERRAGRKKGSKLTCFGDGDGEVRDDDEPPGFDELAALAAGWWGLDWQIIIKLCYGKRSAGRAGGERTLEGVVLEHDADDTCAGCDLRGGY